jgi:deglycase
MSDKLKGKRVAILATDGVEQVELLEPKKALEEAGATTEVISPKDGKIKGWNHTEWGQEIPVNVNL